jgi:hypothetical protein
MPPDCAARPTGVDWDARISAVLFAVALGEVTPDQAEERIARLVGWREEHDRITARARAEREPDIDQLILERERGNR